MKYGSKPIQYAKKDVNYTDTFKITKRDHKITLHYEGHFDNVFNPRKSTSLLQKAVAGATLSTIPNVAFALDPMWTDLQKVPGIEKVDEHAISVLSSFET